ncbi:MAG TPA: hypothetical protein VIF10_07300 [Methylobacter sp.]|jgi:hypothetical protein
MSQYTLTENLYLYPTPAGAYYAVASTKIDKPAQFLRLLLREPQTPAMNLDTLRRLMDMKNADDQCLELLLHCQQLGWVQGINEPIGAPEGSLEVILPELLAAISLKGKVLLADNQGFYLSTSGFPHEVAEELSALSAEIAAIHERRSGVLSNNMGISSNAWAIVDAAGNSKVGFWPVYLGTNRFVLVISGIPYFNRPELVTLIWALSIRYA